MDILKKELDLTFDDATEKVESILKKEGFGVITIVDIGNLLKQKLELDDYRRCKTILACNLVLADMALNASIDMSTLFPCSFVLYEEKNKIIVAHISIMKIGLDLGIAPKDKLDNVIEMTGKLVKKVWNQI